MFYISTSRKPSPHTRTLAKWLSRLFGGKYENRGKRSFDELVKRSKKNGLGRILFVYESHGNPFELSAFDTEKEEWLLPKIKVKSIEFPKEQKSRVPKKITVQYADNEAKNLEKIFENRLYLAEEDEDLPKVTASISNNLIEFRVEENLVGPKIKIEISKVKTRK
ncbi:MAG: hypothetical protein ACE5DI_01395 [Candidatus Micrarchaeia archaeon]